MINTQNKKIGDTIRLPVHMDKGIEWLNCTIIGLYPRFFRVECIPNEKYKGKITECFAYYGKLE